MFISINNVLHANLQSAIDSAVKELLSLKAAYKAATGQDWNPNSTMPFKKSTETTNNVKGETTPQKV